MDRNIITDEQQTWWIPNHHIYKSLFPLQTPFIKNKCWIVSDWMCCVITQTHTHNWIIDHVAFTTAGKTMLRPLAGNSDLSNVVKSHISAEPVAVVCQLQRFSGVFLLICLLELMKWLRLPASKTPSKACFAESTRLRIFSSNTTCSTFLERRKCPTITVLKLYLSCSVGTSRWSEGAFNHWWPSSSQLLLPRLNN